MIKGKKGLIIGIANDHSIAWGITKQLHAHGANLAITYQNSTLLKRVKPLADKVNSDILIECDVNNEYHLQNSVNEIKKKFGKIDFIIHAVAYSDKNELNIIYKSALNNNKNTISNNKNVIFDIKKEAELLSGGRARNGSWMAPGGMPGAGEGSHGA